MGSLHAAVLGGSKFWDGVDAVMKEREKARKEEATRSSLRGRRLSSEEEEENQEEEGKASH